MLPRVSCILPAGYGDTYVGMAIQCFLNQKYEGELELVLIDNNDREVAFGCDIPWSMERIAVQYHTCKRMPVGALRNFGTQHATGEIICTWDEDDWYSPERIAFQVNRLIETGKSVTGFHNLLYYDMRDGQAWKYFFSPDRPHHPYAPGGSQCYLKSWWEKHQFEATGVEDLPFSTTALHANELDSTDCGVMYVARMHSNNIIPKQLQGRQWQQQATNDLPEQFLNALGIGKQ
jgi:glycosyltransferase involved in cell wall biosynthesis